MSFFKRIFSSEKKETLDKGLEQTKTSFFSKLTKAVAGKSKVDDEVLDNLEEVLVSSDVGVNTTLKIIERIESRVANDKYMGTEIPKNFSSVVRLNNTATKEELDALKDQIYVLHCALADARNDLAKPRHTKDSIREILDWVMDAAEPVATASLYPSVRP